MDAHAWLRERAFLSWRNQTKQLTCFSMSALLDCIAPADCNSCQLQLWILSNALPVPGDDVWGDDPTINQLQQTAAQMFGYDAALFCPSGTMTNQSAYRHRQTATKQLPSCLGNIAALGVLTLWLCSPNQMVSTVPAMSCCRALRLSRHQVPHLSGGRVHLLRHRARVPV